MKNLYKSLILLCCSILFLFSCGNEDDSYGLAENTALTLLNPTVNNIIINSDAPSDVAISIAWDDNSGAGAPYTIEGSTLQDFSNAIDFGTSDSDHFMMTMQSLNDMMNNLNVSPFTGAVLYLRVVSGMVESNSISYSVSSFPNQIPVISEPSNGDSFSLTEATANNVATTISWTDFDNSASGVTIMYKIQAALAGTDFANPIELGEVTSTSADMNMYELTESDLNLIALAAGIPSEGTGQLDLRIIANIETAAGSMIVRSTDPVTITVTTYNIDYPNLFFVGSSTAADWNNPASGDMYNAPLFRSRNDPSIFYYTGKFNQGSFKMLEVIGQWQPQWGSNDGGMTLAVNDGTGSDPGTIDVSTDGYYTYTFDFTGNTGTITSQVFDVSNSPTYTRIGIIGPAIDSNPETQWAQDFPLTQSVFDVHQWYATGIPLNVGDFKFRANNGWDVNWGDPGADLYGQGTQGGSNMNLTEAGIYNIYFNDLDGSYILIPN